MRIASMALIVAVLETAIGCTAKEPPHAEPAAASAPPALETIATTRQVMLGITIPTSDIVFRVGEQAPTDDAAWDKVQANALALAESGTLLMMGSRAIDQQDWLAGCKALIETAKQASQAAGEKNVDKVLEAGNQIYEVCEACHKKYMPARSGV